LALRVLLQRIGSAAMLRHWPSVVKDILDLQTSGGSTASSPRLALLLELLEGLEEDRAQCRAYWLPAVARALTRPGASVRARVGEHALPYLMKFDPTGWRALVQQIRELPLATDQTSSEPQVLFAQDVQQWAIIEVVRKARRHGASGCNDDCVVGAKAGVDGCVVEVTEVEHAGLHSSEALRLAALELIADSRKTATLPPPHEIELFMRVFPVSLKTSSPEARHVLEQISFQVLRRIRDCLLRSGLKAKPKGKKREKNGEKENQQEQMANKGEVKLRALGW
ncbi:unnamed protein product, partial [Chrysoparadoxa australica]